MQHHEHKIFVVEIRTYCLIYLENKVKTDNFAVIYDRVLWYRELLLW